MSFSEPKPVSASWTVLSGAIAVLSALDRPLAPFAASTPTTVNGMPATSTLFPTGFAVPNRSLAASAAEHHHVLRLGHLLRGEVATPR